MIFDVVDPPRSARRARVIALHCSGAGASQWCSLAEALGIGEATVKTHLHRLFGKTGASRQADLVKLVAGLSNPLIDRAKLLPRAIAINRSTDAAPFADWHPSLP